MVLIFFPFLLVQIFRTLQGLGESGNDEQRIADFMGQKSAHFTHDGQFFLLLHVALAQRTRGDVPAHDQNVADAAQRRMNGISVDAEVDQLPFLVDPGQQGFGFFAGGQGVIKRTVLVGLRTEWNAARHGLHLPAGQPQQLLLGFAQPLADILVHVHHAAFLVQQQNVLPDLVDDGLQQGPLTVQVQAAVGSGLQHVVHAAQKHRGLMVDEGGALGQVRPNGPQPAGRSQQLDEQSQIGMLLQHLRVAVVGRNPLGFHKGQLVRSGFAFGHGRKPHAWNEILIFGVGNDIQNAHETRSGADDAHLELSVFHLPQTVFVNAGFFRRAHFRSPQRRCSACQQPVA